MSKAHAPRKPFETPQKSALGGRVFKISLKGIPPVNAKMWAQMVSHIFYFQPHNMPAFYHRRVLSLAGSRPNEKPSGLDTNGMNFL